MDRSRWRRSAGFVGLAWFVVQVLAVVLFVAAGTAPSFSDAGRFAAYISSGSGLFVADALLTNIGWILLLVLFTGIRGVIREAGDDWNWAAAMFFGAGMVLIATGLTGGAVEATAAYASKAGASATAVDTVWLASAVLFTVIYFPIALVLATVSYVALRTDVLPRWNGWLAGTCAVLTAVGAFTVLGGTGSLGPTGLLPYILGFIPSAVWVLAVSLVLMRGAPRAA